MSSKKKIKKKDQAGESTGGMNRVFMCPITFDQRGKLRGDPDIENHREPRARASFSAFGEAKTLTKKERA